MTDTQTPAALPGIAHDTLLAALARAEPIGLKTLAEGLIGRLGEIEVLENRSGLVMLPMRDTAAGGVFHLGEILVAEAHVRSGGQEGYGVRRGRDLEAAMAMALIDLAVARDVGQDVIANYIGVELTRQDADDTARMRDVEATRIDMETF